MYRSGFCPRKNNVVFTRVMTWEASTSKKGMETWCITGKCTKLRSSAQTLTDPATKRTTRISYCFELRMHSIWDLDAVSAAALKVNLGVYFAPAGVIQQKEQRRELRRTASHMIKEPCKQRTCSIFMMCRVWPMVFPKKNFAVIICSLSPKTVGTSLKHYLTNIFNSSVDRLVYDLTASTSCRILISK